MEKISETYNEALTFLEKSKELSKQSKIVILATYLGFKEVSEFEIGPIDITEFNNSEKQFISYMEEMMKKIGLFCKPEDTDYDRNDNTLVLFRFAISRTAGCLDKLNLIDWKDEEEKNKHLGKVFGFPETSIEAYAKGSVLKEKDFPSDITGEDKKFLFFRLSKDNWKDEISWLRKIIVEIKNKFPQIYNEIIS